MRPRNYPIFLALIAALLTLTSVVCAQTPNKFEDAQERAKDAARIITLLGVLPDSDLPKELIDRAQAIGVFPKVKKETIYLSSFTQGYGVISARTDAGWTMPAFYQFSGGGYGNPFARPETTGIMMLFMTKDAVSWFEKGGVQLRNEKKAVEGPVGVITNAQRKEIEGAQILAYAYYNGRLSGKAFGKSFWKSFLLNPDNNINTPLYGMKGREVLAGTKISTTAQIPSTITTFKDALEKYYSVSKTSAVNQ
ncbi:MAG TPA: lipid-binding SYLF domain-containing protein [Pyrinomonadaceae bacterium]